MNNKPTFTVFFPSNYNISAQLDWEDERALENHCINEYCNTETNGCVAEYLI